MSMPHGVDLSVDDGALGVLAFRGPDAARFLQGQLSADVEKLAPGASTLAGLHNVQGRVVALLALARTGPDEILAALPAALAPAVAQRLGKFVFRARVRISDESAAVRVLGMAPGDPPDGCAQIAWRDARLLIVPRDRDQQAGNGAARMLWEQQDVAAGMPQVYAATSEQFVAQMLNLDLLGAIAYDKGCYTGQEVIARAHYRGRVKRRLQRWRHAGGARLAPGDAARTADGRSLTVVRVAPAGAAGFELLAVGNYADPGEATGAAHAGNDAAVLVEGPLPLPYSLPE